MIIKHKRMVKFELIRDGQVVKSTVVNKTVGFNENNGNWTIPVFLFEGRHTVEIIHEGQTFTVKVCHLDTEQLNDKVIDAFLNSVSVDDPERAKRIAGYLADRLKNRACQICLKNGCSTCHVYGERCPCAREGRT